MKKMQKTNKKSIYFIGFVLLLLTGIGIVQITSSYNKNKELEAEVVRLEMEKEALKIEQVELKQTISEIGERAFIEKMAHVKFGLIYPDWVLIDKGELD